MLIAVPCRPLSELLQAPDHCSVLGEVNFTNCPLAGRVVIGIRMGVVRPEQGKLQEPLGAFGKRVARVALLLCQVTPLHIEHEPSAHQLAPRLHITFEIR